MSLKIWLPFDKDLENIGLLNIPNFSLKGFTQEAGGKIGQHCYTDCGILHFSEDFLENQWSLTCWVKSTSWGANNDIILCKNNNQSTNCQFYLSIVNGKTFNLGINGGSSNGAGGYSYTFNSNTWYHVAATYDGLNYAMYINGDKIKFGTYNSKKPSGLINLGIGCRSTNANGTGQTGGVQKRLNDVRIYDHALSPLEVKQISQGLILHYPLNRNGWGNENLLKYTQVNTLNKNLLKTNISTIWDKLTLTTKDGYDCYLYPMAQSSTWFNSSTWYRLKANTVYTYSAYIYFTQNANFNFSSLGHFQVYNAASTASDKSHEDIVSARVYEPSTIQANKWTKIRITFTTNNLADSGFVIYPRYNISTNVGDLYIRNFKLEEGAIATPWCPNSADELYNTLGLNNNIQYDTSGYGNNGTKVGISYSSNTPKYNISTVFDNNTDTVTIKPCYSVGQKIEEMSCSIWFKTSTLNSTAPNQVSLGENSFFRFRIASATSTWYYIRIGSTQCGGTFSCKNLIDNQWHHIVVIFNKGYVYVYIDSNLIGTGNHTSVATYMTCNSAGNSWHLGGYTANSENLIGSESDFRIYATALSAQDVLSLYNNSAYIDNQGNIYGAVYEEV